MSLPVAMDLISKQPSVKASVKTVQFTANNGGSFLSSGNSIIRIPISGAPSQWLNGAESYLKFTIRNNSSVSATIDDSFASVFQRVRLLAGSVVLSDLNGYNVLHKLLTHLQGSDELNRFNQICAGASRAHIGAGNADNITLTDTNPLGTLAATNDGTRTATVAVSLINGLLNSGKFIPIGLLASSLTLELYLDPNFSDVFNHADGGNDLNYTISSINYVAQIIDVLDTNVNNQMRAELLRRPMEIHTDDWVLNQNALPASGTFSAIISDRSQSLKNIISIIKRSGSHNISGMNAYKCEVQHYQYSIGNDRYPIQRVEVGAKNLCESFLEAQKCFTSSLFSLKNTTYANITSFGNDSTGTANACFCMAVDLESFAESSGGIESGLNTSQISTPIILNGAYTNTGTPATQLYTYCHKDVIFMIDATGQIVKSE
jgi:hypothetical protein